MRQILKSAVVCVGTVAAAALVAFGEPARADLLIAGAATAVAADAFDAQAVMPITDEGALR